MKHILFYFILFYQKIISPYLPKSCRYIPSCSEYAKIAVMKYGALKGGWLSFKRVLRCNSLAKKIYDPVP